MKRSCHIAYLILLSLYFIIAGCTKEYSFEGGNNLIRIDTIQAPLPIAYVCPYCPGNNTFQENKWSLRDDTLLRCGIIDTAIVNQERTAFTFYGPSACSSDTGIVINILLDPIHLNRNLTNVTSSKTAFYYYDNVGQTYIYITSPRNPFTITIDFYNHQTRLATGTFSGFADKTRGGGTSINSGKFSIKLH